MSDTIMTKLTSIPIDGVDVVLVDGSVTRVILPGGIEITAPYSSLSISGPKAVKLEAPKPEAFDEIGF